MTKLSEKKESTLRNDPFSLLQIYANQGVASEKDHYGVKKKVLLAFL